MDQAISDGSLNESCCVPGAYSRFNLHKANPFDPRAIKSQANPWCSNELILREKDLRCMSRVQPLDLGLDLGARRSHAYNKEKGLIK